MSCASQYRFTSEGEAYAWEMAQELWEAEAEDERDREIAGEIERAQAIADPLTMSPVTPPDFGDLAPATPPLSFPSIGVAAPVTPPLTQPSSSDCLPKHPPTHVPRRLRFKQRANVYDMQHTVQDDVVDMAHAAELSPLSEDVRRQHIHWTHVRTKRTSDKQPEAFTREQFWQHLAGVYKEVYADSSSPTGSILQFGAVVKERHAECNQLGARSIQMFRPCLVF